MNASIAADERGAATRLFALGFLTLFLELSLIRFLAGSVWNLGYFPNLVLLAVFVGMGVGFVFHGAVPSRASPLVFSLAFVVLATIGLGLHWARPAVPGFGSWSGELGGELYFTATPEAGGGGYLPFVLLFLALVLVFAGISQRTAKLFARFRPLRAYTLDIVGSVLGIATFTLASFVQLPAYAWFLLALPPTFWVSLRDPRRVQRLLPVGALCVLAAAAFVDDLQLMQDSSYDQELEVRWSPYQKVEVVMASSAHPTILVNGINHQEMNSPEELAGSFYQAPHDDRRRRGLAPYRSVLVLGAGSGNDVAAALRNGAEHVDALEIDPVIAEMGLRYHKAEPYQDPRVSLIIDDGRAFMTRTSRSYDLIVFALTDSLVKVSSMAQLRLENYLFTEDSLRRAYALLSPDGELLLYNFYRRPWLVEKFERVLHAATGRYPATVRLDEDFLIFMVGPRYGTDSSPSPSTKLEVATDDWPFPYLKHREIPTFYVRALGAVALSVLLLLGLYELHDRRTKQSSEVRADFLTKLAFVLMGAAFLLLETKSIVQFSLLFGTTWLNSSLVFAAILLLVLAANATAHFVRDARLVVLAYLLLMLSCGLTLRFPLSGLLALESATLRFVLASLMTFLPIFFANLIFSASFRDQRMPERLFGWNLLGATLGGVLEYTSMALGYNALALIVAASYALVFLLLYFARGRHALPGAEAEVLSPAPPPR